ncbi:MAG: PAS domain S-box protein, partial [Chitinophagaceae bacterium]|nr:PAS domain S-box protein [Chitinophagaceae bacterium]
MDSTKIKLPGFLAGGGKMAELIYSMDWSTHTLGDTGQWSPTLRSAVSFCLNSRFPMSVMWGDELLMIYNDTYCELLGEKHPFAMGAKASDVWSETWSQMGVTIQDVLQNGTATWSEDQLLVMEGNGFSETCYFSSSYCAIRNEDGVKAGVYCTINETSKRVRAMAHELTEQVMASIKIEENNETPQPAFNINLKESEERFRLLADQMPLFAFIIEPNEEATISYWNKTWLDYTGQTFNEALGRTWDGIIHADDIDGIMAVYVPAFEKREPYYLPAIRVKRYDGVYRWHMAKGNPRYLPDGTFMGYIGVGFDIHESKLAVDALKESEERLRKLIDKAPSPICILKGEDMVLEVANEPVFKVWGVDKSALGKPFLEIIPEMKDQPFIGYLLDVYNNGVTHYGSEQAAYFKRSNGETETIYFNFVYQPYRENNGTITGVMVLASDVTEQVVSRKKMEQQASMVNNLLMTAPAFICTLLGKEHVYDMINERYQKMFGKRILKNKPILEALPELVGQGFDTLLDNVYKTGETYVGIDIPARLALDENLAPELCYFNFSYQPMYNEHGEIYSILVFGYEVTEKALFNQEIKESESHFRQMADLMPAKITSKTPDGGVTYYNKEWLDYTEMTFEELIDFGYHTIMHPDEVPVFQKLFTEAANEGKALEMEMRFMNKQGEYIWHLNRASPVKDENGNIKMWLGVTSDIHNHKIQEEELEKAVLNRTIELKEANEKLHFESEEREKRAVELRIADSKLLFQNEEKEKRAEELVIANKELVFQNEEKENRAAELVIANKELAFQNEEKENRAAELSIANTELVFQNIEKKKRVIENKELEAISNSVKQASQYARSLIEASLDPLVTISPEGKITDVNEASVTVTGVPRLELIGTDFSDYFTKPQKAREGYKQVFEKEFVSDYPLTIHHKNGTLTDVLYNASVYKDEKGNVLGVFAAARDVTAQKQASQYARSLIEASLDPLVTISPEGKITDVNEASVTVTGVPRLELIGTDFSDYFTEPQKAREGYKQVFEKEFVSDYPLTIHHKNGTLTDVLYNASVYKDEKGNVLGVFAAARDVTAQKAEELSLANKELVLQNKEKEKQAAVLEIANTELKFQNQEKENRAAELVIANKELLFQNDEKENRAAELVIANKELAFQNEEKENRAA